MIVKQSLTLAHPYPFIRNSSVKSMSSRMRKKLKRNYRKIMVEKIQHSWRLRLRRIKASNMIKERFMQYKYEYVLI